MSHRAPVRSRSELPSARTVRTLGRLLAPALFATKPLLLGVENIPKTGPLLFVGNHTVYGLLDTWALFLGLFEARGIWLRGLGDHVHFEVPVWRDALLALGAVDGTRENCATLFAMGESVLVFPGGAREVSKRKGEKYTLMWKERIGFARMAIAHQATIIPFSAVGVEDAFDLVLDAQEIFASPLGPLLRRIGVRDDVLLPLGRGIGPTPIPRPERLYFEFAAPISTAPYAGQQDDDEACRSLRDRVKTDIERGIESLRERQANDPDRNLEARIRRSAKRKIAEATKALRTRLER